MWRINNIHNFTYIKVTDNWRPLGFAGKATKLRRALNKLYTNEKCSPVFIKKIQGSLISRMESNTNRNGTVYVMGMIQTWTQNVFSLVLWWDAKHSRFIIRHTSQSSQGNRGIVPGHDSCPNPSQLANRPTTCCYIIYYSDSTGQQTKEISKRISTVA